MVVKLLVLTCNLGNTPPPLPVLLSFVVNSFSLKACGRAPMEAMDRGHKAAPQFWTNSDE